MSLVAQLLPVNNTCKIRIIFRKNNKLFSKICTEFFNYCGHGSLSVLHFELRYRGTSFKVQGGSLNWAILLAQNYVTEQFTN